MGSPTIEDHWPFSEAYREAEEAHQRDASNTVRNDRNFPGSRLVGNLPRLNGDFRRMAGELC